MVVNIHVYLNIYIYQACPLCLSLFIYLFLCLFIYLSAFTVPCCLIVTTHYLLQLGPSQHSTEPAMLIRFISNAPSTKFNRYLKIPVFLNLFATFQIMYCAFQPHPSLLTRLVSAAPLPFHVLTRSWLGFLIAQRLPLYTSS